MANVGFPFPPICPTRSYPKLLKASQKLRTASFPLSQLGWRRLSIPINATDWVDIFMTLFGTTNSKIGKLSPLSCLLLQLPVFLSYWPTFLPSHLLQLLLTPTNSTNSTKSCFPPSKLNSEPEKPQGLLLLNSKLHKFVFDCTKLFYATSFRTILVPCYPRGSPWIQQTLLALLALVLVEIS